MRELFSKEKWRQMFYTVAHPSDGYYWIRHQDKGSVPIALLMVALFALTFSLSRIYTSFVVNVVNPREVNALTELIGVAVLFLILCVANWSITCLMGGEGRFKDIVVAVGYALFPMIVTLALSTLVSLLIAENEEAFYSLILVVGIAYAGCMLLIGIMQVHAYSLGKTLGTLFLTVISLLIIIFLSMLIINFITQVVGFFESVYTELIYRM